MKGDKLDWKHLKDVDQKLLEALDRKQFEEVDRLLKDGANVNVCFGPSDSALHYFEDVAIISKLLKCGADVNHRNKYGETALMYAVLHNKHCNIVKLLLKYGANVQCSNRRGGTVLCLALRFSRFGHGEETIRALLEFGSFIEVSTLYHYNERASKLLIKYSLVDENVYFRMNVIKESGANYMKYAVECQAELDLMKSVKLNESSLSLLDVIKKWHCWSPNQSIVKYLKDYEQRYPIYADVIFGRIFALLSERQKLLRKLDALVVAVKESEGIILDMNCKRHIMKYVHNKDLEVFTNAIGPTVDSGVDSSLDLSEPYAKRAKIE